MRGVAAGSGRGVVTFNRDASPPWPGWADDHRPPLRGQAEAQDEAQSIPGDTDAARCPSRRRLRSSPVLSSRLAIAVATSPQRGTRDAAAAAAAAGRRGRRLGWPSAPRRGRGDGSGAQRRAGEEAAAERGRSASSR